MTVRPANIAELQSLLAGCHATSTPAPVLDLASLNSLIAHTPEDMTATVQTGLPWRDLQRQLRERGQWLPVDPPAYQEWTVSDLLALNLSGPRRFGYGMIRDYLIGIKVVLADGRLIKAGGNVVKNVAGYDLCKLFVGSRNTLGIPVEATFKLRPLPEAEMFLEHIVEGFAFANAGLQKLWQANLQPCVLDLSSAGEKHRISVGFDGALEDVRAQEASVMQMGFAPAELYTPDSNFWMDPPPNKTSVLPSEVVTCLNKIQPGSYLARAGNGIIYSHGGKPPPPKSTASELGRRLKEVYDPHHVLPELQL